MSKMYDLNTHIHPKTCTHCCIRKKYNMRETEDAVGGKDFKILL